MDLFTYILNKNNTTIIQNEIENVTSFENSIVNELPETGEKGYIYFIPAENSNNNNLYDEYLYINNTWEKINSEIDLSGYATKNEINGVAPLESPSLIGTPTAPTAKIGTNTNQIATTAFVQTAIDKAISDSIGGNY